MPGAAGLPPFLLPSLPHWTSLETRGLSKPTVSCSSALVEGQSYCVVRQRTQILSEGSSVLVVQKVGKEPGRVCWLWTGWLGKASEVASREAGVWGPRDMGGRG